MLGDNIDFRGSGRGDQSLLTEYKVRNIEN